MRVLIQHLPRNCALHRELHGDVVTWDTSDFLLATTVDLLQGANWQRGRGKGPRPKPVPRPGSKDEKHYGKGRPLAEVRDLFDRWKAGEVVA